MKQRFAAALHDARRKRGGGDASTFPQHKMAEEIGYSLRQYQRLENPNVADLPPWTKIEKIADQLDLDLSTLFADPEPANGATPSADVRLLFRSIREDLAGVLVLVEQLESRLRQAEHLSEEDRA